MVGVRGRQVVLLVVKVRLLRRRRQNVVSQTIDRSTDFLGTTLRAPQLFDVGGVHCVSAAITVVDNS